MSETFGVVILIQNEKQFWLREVIESALYSFVADEIIIVDGGSTDGSIQAIHEWFGDDARIKIVNRPFLRPQDYTNQRNYGLRFLTTSWCLALDADEILSDDSFRLKEIIASRPEKKAWSLEGLHFIYNLGQVDATQKMHIFINRLFRRDLKYPSNSMHGTVGLGEMTNYDVINGTWIFHMGYVKDIRRHVWQQYENNKKKPEMHAPEFLEMWKSCHTYGKVPTKPYAGPYPSVLRMPKIIDWK